MINSLLLDDVAAVKDDFAAEFVGLLLDFITFHSSLFTSYLSPLLGVLGASRGLQGFRCAPPLPKPFRPFGT